MATDEMPYAGIASFFKAPYVPSPTRREGDVAVLGVPFDEGTTNRSGARMGPRALREASTNYAYRTGTEAFYDGEIEQLLLGGVRWVDCGDVALGPTTPAEERHEAIVARLQPIVEAGLFPVTLGGDHSIAYPAFTAMSRARGGEPFQLVQFDTHMDYIHAECGQRFTHASPIIRGHEDGLFSSVTQYGIRGLQTRGDNIELAQERGVHTFWCHDAKLLNLEELVEHLTLDADTYITFDIDALDPAIAPGTGTPEPGGLSYYDAKALLLAIAERCNVIGMDLVEVAPLYDGPGQITALHGARLILDTVGAVFRSRKRGGGGAG